MPHLNLSKICFWDKEIKKQIKIAIHMDLWKHGQNLTIQKSLTFKQLRFFKTRFLVWIYHFVLNYVLSPKKECESIYKKFQTTDRYYLTSKDHYY
jgi:hypothetical protein